MAFSPEKSRGDSLRHVAHTRASKPVARVDCALAWAVRSGRHPHSGTTGLAPALHAPSVTLVFSSPK
nr:MAG TPA: hypothetical protein [Caudoviricetes sp.]